MGPTVYVLGTLTSLLCAVLLLRGYSSGRRRLLLWSGLCFVGLTGSNVFLVLDRLIFPNIDFSTARLSAALVGLLLLIFGLIWEGD